MPKYLFAFMSLLLNIVSFPAVSGNLTADGTIESKTGFVFPDGSVQTTASTGKTNSAEFCWELSVDSIPGALLQLELIEGINSNYFASGRLNDYEGNIISPIYGGIILNGDQLLMTLVESHQVEWSTSVSNFTIVLNSATMDGTFVGFGQDYSYGTNQFEALNQFSGAMSHVTCP